MMKKRHINFGGIIFLVATVYFLYTLLLKDDVLLSIPHMLKAINHCASHWHILVPCLLPIYLAVVIFGASIFGVYCGSALHRWISRLINPR